MVTLIRALGRQYDGDIRIGFWEIGFLGHWGEWHTFPNVSRFASRDHQDQILFAYNSSFIETKLQLRYPHVSGNYNVTTWNVGFHDDSFFLDTYGEYWMFYNRSVDVGATQQWRRHVCFISTDIMTLRTCFFSLWAVKFVLNYKLVHLLVILQQTVRHLLNWPPSTGLPVLN